MPVLPRRSVLLVALALLAAAPAPAALVGGEEADGLEIRPGEVLVKLRPAAAEALRGTGAASLRAVLEHLNVSSWEQVFPPRARAGGRAPRVAARFARRGVPAPDAGALPDLDPIYLLRAGADADLRQVLGELLAHPDVVYAEPNYVLRIAEFPLPDVAFVPDDPYVSRDGATWAEGTWEQPYPDLWGIRISRVLEAWDRLDPIPALPALPGAGVVVAVVDSGLDREHPDIAANVWSHPGEIAGNGIDDDGNGFVDDVHGWDFVEDDADPADPHGHGTHVSGTVAGRGHNGIDVTGVAPGASILPVRGLGPTGSGSVATLARAVRYAADAGADVISASWGGLGRSQVLEDAFEYAHALGVVAVASAGNANGEVSAFHPANIESVITVAATDADDVRASFSNFGRGVDISAPGVDVLSLNANGGKNAIADQVPDLVVSPDTIRLSGTSMSCPHVSGAAAVLLARYPDATPEEVRARLQAGAAPIDEANPGLEGALGAGRLDLEAALAAEPRPLIELVDQRSGIPEPGAELELVVQLRNAWQEARGLGARLVPLDPHAQVTQDRVELGTLASGETAANEEQPFLVTLDPATPFGARLPFELELTGEGGFRQVLLLDLAITLFHDTGRSTFLPLQDFVPWRIVPRDYDRDGRTDVFFVGFFETKLLRNHSSGLFVDTTLSAGLDIVGILTHEGLFADFDDDGDTDLFVGGLQMGSRLFLNETGERFVNVTAASDVRGRRSFTTSALDWDGDGRLDLLGGQARDFADDAIKPESLFLLRNLGLGLFQDRIGETCLPANTSLELGQLVTLDYDADGDSDFLWGSDAGAALTLYRNDGAGRFEDVTMSAGLAVVTRLPCTEEGRPSPRSGGGGCRRTLFGDLRRERERVFRNATGIVVGDIDNDADPDLFVTGGVNDRGLLFRNDGGVFRDVTSTSGDLAQDELSGVFWGNVFFDYDNDGDLDLYVTNDGTGSRAHALYSNDGSGHFTRVTANAFPGPAIPGGAAAAVMDYNRDGALDIYAPTGILSGAERGALFENVVATRNGNHWLKVALRGVASPRDPFGAQVRVDADGLTLLREMRVAALEVQPLHFGLGRSETVSLEVRWPSGIVQRVEGVDVDRTLELVEPAHCLEADAEDPTCAGVSIPEEERERQVPRRRARPDRSTHTPRCP